MTGKGSENGRERSLHQDVLHKDPNLKQLLTEPVQVGILQTNSLVATLYRLALHHQVRALLLLLLFLDSNL